MIADLETRFWAKVQVGSPDECWEWTGAKKTRGYGHISVGGKMIGAHRISWLLHFGEIPAGYSVCHHCDNPSCVNPSHLFVGTHLDNMQDMIRKGRDYHRPGYQVSNSKIIPEMVKEIRHQYADGHILQRELAQEYEITKTQIGRIVRGENWPHVDGPITKRGSGRR